MTSPGSSLNDLKSGFYGQFGYTGSITDMEYQYYSVPPNLNSMGYVRTASPPATTVAALSAPGYTHFHRVIEGGTISAIRIYVNIQSGNICLSIHKNTGSGLNALPGNQVVSTGSVACPGPTVGNYDIPLGSSIKVAVGDWIAFGVDNTTARFGGTGGAGSGDPAAAGSFAAQNAYPAPTVPTAVTSNARMFALVGIP